MSKKEEIHGICVACKIGPTCVNAQTMTIWDCEQFEPYEAVVVKKFEQSVAKLQHPKAGVVLTEIKSGKYKGQCYYCDIRTECTLTKPKGGAWECEEYR
jgi:hypothetical protein